MLFNSPLLARVMRACVRVRDSQLPLQTLRSEGTPGAVCSHNKQHGGIWAVFVLLPACYTCSPSAFSSQSSTSTSYIYIFFKLIPGMGPARPRVRLRLRGRSVRRSWWWRWCVRGRIMRTHAGLELTPTGPVKQSGHRVCIINLKAYLQLCNVGVE